MSHEHHQQYVAPMQHAMGSASQGDILREAISRAGGAASVPSSAPLDAMQSAMGREGQVRAAVETLLVGNITPAHLAQQSTRPRRLADDEYVATLPSGGPGAPSYIIGQRVADEPFSRVVLAFGPADRPWQRTWILAADRGAEVDYRLLDDTSSTGFAASA
ncbi:hypothetical protein ACL9RL_13340 [Plantibacter sp. Mn2098]|uniref:hypothetical protein n=1 Tax=Plantibacter sp. Mn2098 TaxID=3395266 RepID=UPI003BC13CA7